MISYFSEDFITSKNYDGSPIALAHFCWTRTPHLLLPNGKITFSIKILNVDLQKTHFFNHPSLASEFAFQEHQILEKTTPALIPLLGVNGQRRNQHEKRNENAKWPELSIAVEGSGRPILSSLKSWKKMPRMKMNKEQQDTGVYLVRKQYDSYI